MRAHSSLSASGDLTIATGTGLTLAQSGNVAIAATLGITGDIRFDIGLVASALPVAGSVSVSGDLSIAAGPSLALQQSGAIGMSGVWAMTSDLTFGFAPVVGTECRRFFTVRRGR